MTDDAARVGRFTLGGSATLAIALSVAGAIGGAVLVHDHPSFDYSILQPTWLAVLVFIAVPATYGAPWTI